MDNDKRLRLSCNCFTHELEVYHDPDDDLKEISLSFWKYGHDGLPFWDMWHRIKIAWMVLWSGHCYGDMVSLNAKSIRSLHNFLDDIDPHEGESQ